MNELSTSWVSADWRRLSPFPQVGWAAPIRRCNAKMTVKSDIVLPSSPDHLAEALQDIAALGDRAAFAVLFAHFAPRVKTYLVRLGAAQSQAEDIAQETMLMVWRKAVLYDPAKASPAAWVFTIARNLRIDALRKERHPAALELQFETEPPPEPMADTILDQAQQGGLLLKALQSLPKEQEEVIRLAYFSDKPHSEIEQELRIPLGTVKSRLRLAMARLRALMEEYR